MDNQLKRRLTFAVLLAACAVVMFIWPPFRISRAAKASLIIDNNELSSENVFGVSEAAAFSFSPGIELTGGSAPNGLWLSLQIPNDPRIQFLTNRWTIKEANGLVEFTSSAYQKTNCPKRSGRIDLVFPQFAFGYKDLVLASLLVKAGVGTNLIAQSQVHLAFTSPTNSLHGAHYTGEKATEWLKRAIGPKYQPGQLYFIEASQLASDASPTNTPASPN